MTNRVWAEINLPVLKLNLQRVMDLCPHSNIMGVLKADAYGHGLAETARFLAPFLDGIAVTDLREGVILREAGIILPITVLSGFHAEDEIEPFLEHRLIPVLHHPIQIDWLIKVQCIIPFVWLKYDSGMRRLGLNEEQVEHALTLFKARFPEMEVGLLTHLASAFEMESEQTVRQLLCVKEMLKRFPVKASIANSAGILAWPESRSGWVRPGMMLYGVSPIENKNAEDCGLTPVMTMKSRLISVKSIKAGALVGYGGVWRAPKDTIIGVVSCGYADGYPRHAPSGTPVLVNDQEARLIGRVSMDLISIDLTGVENPQPGNTVTLWGKNLPVENIATHADTIGYELVTRVAARVPRIYQH